VGSAVVRALSVLIEENGWETAELFGVEV
jgi:hypothetical protein